MTFWVRFLEISADFHHRKSLFTTSFHYIFTTFSPHLHHNLHHRIFSWHLFTTFSPQIFTTKGRTDRDKQTPWGHTDRFSPQRDEQTGTNRLHGDTQTDFYHRFSPQIYTTDFHYKFSPQIYTTDFYHRSHSCKSVIWGTNRQKLT